MAVTQSPRVGKNSSFERIVKKFSFLGSLGPFYSNTPFTISSGFWLSGNLGSYRKNTVKMF